MSDAKDIEMGEDAVTNPSTDNETTEEEELEKGLIRVVCLHCEAFMDSNLTTKSYDQDN